MAKLNHHFSKLSQNYLFSEIERRIAAYRETHGQCGLLDLGIGDITQPVPPTVVNALGAASAEMGREGSFRGYGPSAGYPFLREAIAQHEYSQLGISAQEIFVSTGIQTDIANFQELFDEKNRVGIPDPTYPVYLDSNVIAGRTRALLKTGRYGGITYLPCNEANGFKPQIPQETLDLIYLCAPNNPTGVALDRTLLTRWVEYARRCQAVILFDGAYSAFATQSDVPKSIYEIEGAHEVAVEFRSFSKYAGFTGLRCSYTVVPYALQRFDCGSLHSLNRLWKRLHDTKFNGVPYPVQRAAEAVYTQAGQREVQGLVSSYLTRASYLRAALSDMGLAVYGGIDAPYLWCKTIDQMSSWDCFDFLLDKYQIVTVPGCGFGCEGEGFIRFSAFAPVASLEEAVARLSGISSDYAKQDGQGGKNLRDCQHEMRLGNGVTNDCVRERNPGGVQCAL